MEMFNNFHFKTFIIDIHTNQYSTGRLGEQEIGINRVQDLNQVHINQEGEEREGVKVPL